MTTEQLNQARAEAWRQNGNPLLTADDAAAWLRETGVCLFLPRTQQFATAAPSFVEAVLGASDATPAREAIETAAGLLHRLLVTGDAVALSLLGGHGLGGPGLATHGEQPDFLATPETLPFLFALIGDKEWKRGPRGKSSPLVIEVWKLLDREGPLSTIEVKEKLGRQLTEAAALRALTELWSHLRIEPVTKQDEPAAWQLLERSRLKQMQAGSTMSQAIALSALVSLYLQSAVAASGDEIELFLSPFSSRSKVREAVRGLTATRQLSTLNLGPVEMYHVEGSLPEFAEIARPDGVVVEVRGESSKEEAEDGIGEGRRRFVAKRMAAEADAAEPSTERVAKPASYRGRIAGRAGGSIANRADGDSKGPLSADRSGRDRRPFAPRPGTSGGERRPYGTRAPGGSSFNPTEPWKEDRKPAAPRANTGERRPFAKRGDDESGERKSFAARESGERRPYPPREGEPGERKPFAPRAGGGSFKPRSGSKPPGERKSFGDRKPFAAREGGERRPFTPGEGGSGERKPFAPRSGGGPFKPRSDGKPFTPREGGGRKPYAPREGGSGDRKPFAPRSGGSSFKPRPGGKLLNGSKSFGEGKPFTPREGGDRKPYAPREGGSGDRKPFTPRAGGSSFNSRSGGKSFGAGKSFGDRKPFAPREGGERKSFSPREGGSGKKPFSSRADGNSFKPRSEGKSFGGGKTFGERKPFLPREGSGSDRKPFTPREGGERKPFTQREGGERKAFAPRSGDRPFKPRSDAKPFRERKPFSPREGGEREPFPPRDSAGRAPSGAGKESGSGARKTTGVRKTSSAGRARTSPMTSTGKTRSGVRPPLGRPGPRATRGGAAGAPGRVKRAGRPGKGRSK